MKKVTSESSSKLERKTIERNRRIHVRGLCFKLSSLIPSHYCKTSMDMLSQQDRLDLAASYINQLKARIDGLMKRKELAITSRSLNSNNDNGGRGTELSTDTEVKLPIVELREWESGLEVSVITGVGKNFMLYEVISILHEEGAEVVSASLATVGVKIFHMLHAQDMLSQRDRFDLAASYIKQLKFRIDGLMKRKELAITSLSPNRNSDNSGRGTEPSTDTGVKLPIVELREWESGLKVSVITGAGKNFMLYEVISILHEEGAEVVSASFATVGDKIFHILHAQVKIVRVGIEITRVWQRLQQLTF